MPDIRLLTAGDGGFLPLDGSVPMTGYINMMNTGNYFALQKDRLVSEVLHRLTLGIGANGATTMEHYKDNVVHARMELNSMVDDPTNALVIHENSGTEAKRIFGEHNTDLLKAALTNLNFVVKTDIADMATKSDITNAIGNAIAASY